MRITMGMHFDGHTPTGAAALGESIVGPLGMLQLLESRLGLSRPSIRPVERLVEAREALAAWYAGGGTHGNDSFERDSLAVAELFLPFTSPDAEGGMVYADRSTVVIDHDPDEFWFGESDWFGYLVSLDKGQYCVTPGLCVLNTLGPCCIHQYEAKPQIPNSRELQERMLSYLKRFIKNDPELKEMKEAI